MVIFFSWADLSHSDGSLSLLRWLLGGKRLGMGIFFSWADLSHSEGGLSLSGWLLGGKRLGIEIFFSGADLSHSALVACRWAGAVLEKVAWASG